MVSDLAIAWVRLRVGLGIDPRAELRGFAWLYLVDAGLACDRLPGRARRQRRIRRCCSPCCRSAACSRSSPTSGAAGSRTRCELQRSAQEGRERLQTIVGNSSDCIMIVGPDGTMRMLTGSVAPIFGPDWEAHAQGAPLLDFVHVDDAAQVRAFVASVAEKADAPQEAEWRMRYADGSFRHVAAAATSLLDDARVRGHRAHRARRRGPQGLRGAAAPPRVPRRR